MKPVKVPVSKNMLDSHLKGELCSKIRTMVTFIIAEAQVFGSFLFLFPSSSSLKMIIIDTLCSLLNLVYPGISRVPFSECLIICHNE